MKTLQSFFHFCSGVDERLLEQCPTDRQKYAGIGATVLFTGVFAFFSSAYALYTVFDSAWAAVGFGLVWGAMIFNLDRYIVMSMKRTGAWWRDLLVATPRLFLALLLALVISKPLEMKIFEKEINAELVIMEQEVFKTQEDKVKARYQSQIDSFSNDIAGLKAVIAAKTADRNSMVQQALQEADGTGGSKMRNLGPIYKAKKAQADQAQAELDALLALNLPAITTKEAAKQEVMVKQQSDVASLERGAYGGLASRMEALSRLSAGSEAIMLASIFITLLFVAIETAPIFVKLIAYRSPYDYLLHDTEHVYEMENLEKVTLRNNGTKRRVHFDTETGEHALKERIQAENTLTSHKVNEQLETLKKSGVGWKWGSAFQ